jgi:hypothetical protein
LFKEYGGGRRIQWSKGGRRFAKCGQDNQLSWEARGFSGGYSTCLLEWRAVYRSGPNVCGGLCPALKKIREEENSLYIELLGYIFSIFPFSAAGFLVNYCVFQLTSTPTDSLLQELFCLFFFPDFLIEI